MNRLFILLAIGFISIFNASAQTSSPKFLPCNNQGCKIFDPLYKDGETLEWNGASQDSLATGKGVLKRFKNGELQASYEGNCVRGMFEGPGNYADKENTVTIGNFVNGYIVGDGVKNWVNGLYYKGDFLNFRMHGKGKLTAPSGLKLEGYFVVDDLYSGTITEGDNKPKFWHKNEIVKKLPETPAKMTPQFGVKTTEYFDNQWKRCEQKDAAYYRLVTYEGPNKPLGAVKDYYINGTLQSEFSAIYLDYYDDGKNFKEGPSIWYFPSGKINIKTYFKNGKQDGLEVSYFENGKVYSEITYVDGVRNGHAASYYANGKKQIQTFYVDGESIDKKYVEYDENDLASLVCEVNLYDFRESLLGNSKGNVANFNSNDELVLELSKKDVGAKRTVESEINQKYDYSIEAKIGRAKGRSEDMYGLIFGFKDWSNYYEFIISESGQYLVYYHANGELYKLATPTYSYSINKGDQYNLLKVKKSNNELEFYINDNLVKTTEGFGLAGSETGLVVYSTGTYILSSIKIREFPPSELLTKWGAVSDNNPEGWIGNGSGFFINEKGYIATNYHVVEEAGAIQVEYFQQGKKFTYRAKVIASDKQNDLAILQISDTTFTSLPVIPYIFNSETKDVGSDVFALGYPIANVMGSEIKFTDGKISSKTGVDGNITTYQISVPIQSGNSGGPLFDSNGNLVGITSSRLNKDIFNSENVNYAIKASYLKNLIDVLPEKIALPNYTDINKLSLTEKIKLLSDFTPIIRVK